MTASSVFSALFRVSTPPDAEAKEQVWLSPLLWFFCTSNSNVTFRPSARFFKSNWRNLKHRWALAVKEAIRLQDMVRSWDSWFNGQVLAIQNKWLQPLQMWKQKRGCGRSLESLWRWTICLHQTAQAGDVVFSQGGKLEGNILRWPDYYDLSITGKPQVA